ncbi:MULTISPECIES: hypothetical protein [unclassified Paraflavitalea]|uniref:hypothetical protein n=1 Tax=unclassified Paraflavitalea TaxID=2798305 RepID=UPI003D3299F0
MNCPDCFKEVRSRKDLLEQVKADAKSYAIANQVNVFIYEEGYNNFKFVSEASPEASQISPMGIVSYMQPANAG